MHITLDDAAHLLSTGQVIAVPTETVYGLAAAIDQPQAVEQIFIIKKRPANNPLIIHVEKSADIDKFVTQTPPNFHELAETFWPGPLTVVLPVNTDMIPDKIRAGLSTAAFRIPLHPMARALLGRTGPLVMPSANLSGRPSATCSDHVETDFGSSFPVLDGGACEKGIESTILYYNEDHWQIIRQGSIPLEAFKPILGYYPIIAKKKDNVAPLCPGQLYRHYAPKAKLILGDKAHDYKGVVVGYSERKYPLASKSYLLGSSTNPESVAENLYALLRQLDADNIVEAYVDFAIPHEGLWETLRERLLKASTKK